GQFKLVNTRYCDLVHRPAAELLQLRIQDILQLSDPSQMTEFLGNAMRTRETLVLENNVGLPDGRRLWIRSNIAVIFDQSDPVRYLVATADDVTPQHDVEDNLKRERQKLLETVEEQAASIKKASETLDAEIEQRKQVEGALRIDIAERQKAQEAL